ncbi:hypothetical protein B0H10DRAFT_1957678 [Mycena sp. CBHHK59/15]|nr:hypothetical protein B0H10DRAFT_1957678 [Mycena sp. CBHHK59/15]
MGQFTVRGCSDGSNDHTDGFLDPKDSGLLLFSYLRLGWLPKAKKRVKIGEIEPYNTRDIPGQSNDHADAFLDPKNGGRLFFRLLEAWLASQGKKEGENREIEPYNTRDIPVRAIWGNTAICACRCNPGWRAGLHYFTLTSGVRISITDRQPHSLDVPAVSDGFGDAGGFLDDFTVLSSGLQMIMFSKA